MVMGIVVEMGAHSIPVVNPSPSLCLSCKDTPSFNRSAAFIHSNPASRPVATPVAFCPCKGPCKACLGHTGVAVGDTLTALPLLRSKGLKDATCMVWFWRQLGLLSGVSS